MSDELVINPQDLVGLTPDEVIKLLDSGWPWPLDAVQEWFEDLWNSILAWLHQAVDWVYDRIKPAFDTVWDWLSSISSWIVASVGALLNQVWSWIQSATASIIDGVSSLFDKVWSWIQDSASAIVASVQALSNQVWSWIQTAFNSLSQLVLASWNALANSLRQFATDIADKVSEINTWFSNEFIDPFLDWLVQLPQHMGEVFTTYIVNPVKQAWGWLLTDDHWKEILLGALIAAVTAVVIIFAAPIAGAILAVVSAIGSAIVAAASSIGAFFTWVFSSIGGWLVAGGAAIGGWLSRILPSIAGWALSSLIPLLGSGSILTLSATGKLAPIIHTFITPAIVGVVNWFEERGPVVPTSGGDISEGLSKLAEFTITGLAAMTLAGEMLSPLKHLGLGNISAVIFDLINYRTLTAAFMGVLAFVYIRTPLQYYYNRIARPYKPDERTLSQLVREYVIPTDEFNEEMTFHGYSDEWIPKLRALASTALAPRMLNYLAAAGILDDELIDRELHHAGYESRTIPYLKTWLQRTASGEVKALSTGTALTRYREGMDDQAMLEQNLAALGVEPKLLPKYAFAAQLMYNYDYQHDLIAYYCDAYHRHDIEEPELRTNLTMAGLSPERLDLVVAAQKIKRLKAAVAAEDPVIAIQFDTIRDRRKKLLITRDEELNELIALGKELPYAIAIADNDDAALAERAAVVTPSPVLLYETEEGKIRVDTIRRLRRQRQISSDDERTALLALEMPQSLAQAIVDNDELRLRKETPEE